MQMNLNHTSGMQFITEVRGHKLTIDVPETYKGEDTGPTPPELLVAALGSCVGMYALMYLRSHNLPTEGLKVDVHWSEEPSPARIGRIEANLVLPEGISPEHAQKALKAAEACKIHQTLHYKPEVCVSIAERPELCLP